MNVVVTLNPTDYSELVRHALDEDIGSGDVTSNAIVPAALRARARIEVRSTCVLAGLDVAAEVVRRCDEKVQWHALKRDGDVCVTGEIAATIEGSARGLLRAERTLLNFLQHLSGVATLTRRFVDAAGGRLTVLDTRKTLPGLRALEKYAVRCGGGTNHRFGLFDAVLIKDNHIRVAGSIAEAVRRVRRGFESGTTQAMPIEVEAQSLGEIDDALEASADIIMLDNLDNATMAQAIERIGGRARTEISGGVTLERLPSLAALGADCVSIGALTHSAPAADISLEIETD